MAMGSPALLRPLAIRPERPLDGIICGIPVDHINIQNGARRQEHIDWYFREFWHIQQLVEFTLPVFVLVPGMQRLDGFDAFWTTPTGKPLAPLITSAHS